MLGVGETIDWYNNVVLVNSPMGKSDYVSNQPDLIKM